MIVYESLPKKADAAAPSDEPVYGKVVKRAARGAAPADAPAPANADADDEIEDETYARVDKTRGAAGAAAVPPPPIPPRTYDETLLPASLLAQMADASMCVGVGRGHWFYAVLFLHMPR
jgi:hypothetical protein